jgi:hypothetical protein
MMGKILALLIPADRFGMSIVNNIPKDAKTLEIIPHQPMALGTAPLETNRMAYSGLPKPKKINALFKSPKFPH